MGFVFVTDGHQRKAIPIVRSLGKRGLRITVGSASRVSPAFFSKYCFSKVVYPSPQKNPEKFAAFLFDYLKENRHEVFLSIDEWTNDVVTTYLEEFTRYTIVPLPAKNIYEKARDKAKTLKIAMSLGIPCPITYFIEDTGEIRRLIQELSFPVIVKPRLSSGSRGIVLVDKRGKLESSYLRVHSKFPFPIIQEFIPRGGDTYGVEVLMNRESEPRAVFVHRRLREYPVDGGPSTLRESVNYPELAKMGVKLLRALNWFGVAMVEFRVDPRDGMPKLMEINPKFWGSIQLPIVAGVDFPYLLYRMATEGDIKPVTDYHFGVKCRWLIPGDILHFIFNKDRFYLDPNFFRLFDRDTYYDILSKDDPGPIWGTIIYYLSNMMSLKLWKEVIR